MRSAYLIKLISGFTATIITLVAVLVFVCPQSVMAKTSGYLLPGTANACPNDSVGSGMMSNVVKISPDCFNLHLGAAQQFTDSLFGNVSALLVIIFLILSINFKFYKVIFLQMTRAILALLNYLHLLYNTHIKLAHQKKMLTWLSLLENHGIALFA